MAAPGRKRRSRGSGSVAVSVGRRPAVRGEVVTPWRSVAVVVRRTRSILRAHAEAGTATAKAAVEIGRQLTHVREALEPGQWLAWVEEAVPFGPRTVQNYLALAAWSERETQAFERLHHLGLSKLYSLASLPRDLLGKLKIDEPIRVPGAGEKTIEVMTIAELDRALGVLATPPVPRARAAQVVQAYRFRLAGLRELNAQLVKQKGAVDRGVASELVAELLGLVQELEQAFGA
jgi:hypothetical protein